MCVRSRAAFPRDPCYARRHLTRTAHSCLGGQERGPCVPHTHKNGRRAAGCYEVAAVNRMCSCGRVASFSSIARNTAARQHDSGRVQSRACVTKGTHVRTEQRRRHGCVRGGRGSFETRTVGASRMKRINFDERRERDWAVGEIDEDRWPLFPYQCHPKAGRKGQLHSNDTKSAARAGTSAPWTSL